MIDESDRELLAGRRWYVSKLGYVFTRMTPKNRYLSLHRHLLSAPHGTYVDHINGNTKDNRRCNLRLCTNRENCRNQTTLRKDNTSGFKGVTWHKRNRNWQVSIAAGELKSNGLRRNIFLGGYPDPVTAAKVYDEAARRYFGQFARCNFDDQVSA